jgi:hypothetical protein
VTGSLMSRSRFCQTKIDFIKKYFEPTVNSAALASNSLSLCNSAPSAGGCAEPGVSCAGAEARGR